jgi:hypothetical protein
MKKVNENYKKKKHKSDEINKYLTKPTNCMFF